MKRRVLLWLGSTLFRCLRLTWRLDEASLPTEALEQMEEGEPVVLGHLHEDEWALLGFYFGRPMAVMVSLSQDGSLMSSFLKKAGFQVVRGSSSRRAVGALLELLRVVRRNKIPRVSLAVDGPRGPRRVVKGGLYQLAKTLHAPVVLGVAYASSAWVFERAWSRAFVPKPFSRVRLEYSPALLVKEGESEESFSRRVEEMILKLKIEAQQRIQSENLK